MSQSILASECKVVAEQVKDAQGKWRWKLNPDLTPEEKAEALSKCPKLDGSISIEELPNGKMRILL